MRNKIMTVVFLFVIMSSAAIVLCHKPDGNLFWGMLGADQSEVLDRLPYETKLVRLSGTVMKTAGMRSYYSESHGINITTTGYNVGQYNQTSTDYEVEQMVGFKEYLDEKGILLLYVSLPAKYIDDSYYAEQFGRESYLNRNTDLFLERIAKQGIDYLDLRDEIREDGLDSMEMFYRTDHHWTVPASVWAAGKVSEKLNADYGYSIDVSMFEEQNYHSVFYKDTWLGEQGKLIADTYIGLDDYTMMEPLFDTQYEILADDGSVTREGDFGIFINKELYTENVDVYDAQSWHYSYTDFNGSTIHNELAVYGNVLIFGDSYQSSMAPFLSLGIENVKVVVPRYMQGSVREIVEAGDYDTVIVAYSQIMIGAHDDESNANYRLFTFD